MMDYAPFGRDLIPRGSLWEGRVASGILLPSFPDH